MESDRSKIKFSLKSLQNKERDSLKKQDFATEFAKSSDTSEKPIFKKCSNDDKKISPKSNTNHKTNFKGYSFVKDDKVNNVDNRHRHKKHDETLSYYNHNEKHKKEEKSSLYKYNESKKRHNYSSDENCKRYQSENKRKQNPVIIRRLSDELYKCSEMLDEIPLPGDCSTLNKIESPNLVNQQRCSKSPIKEYSKVELNENIVNTKHKKVYHDGCIQLNDLKADLKSVFNESKTILGLNETINYKEITENEKIKDTTQNNNVAGDIIKKDNTIINNSSPTKISFFIKSKEISSKNSSNNNMEIHHTPKISKSVNVSKLTPSPEKDKFVSTKYERSSEHPTKHKYRRSKDRDVQYLENSSSPSSRHNRYHSSHRSPNFKSRHNKHKHQKNHHNHRSPYNRSDEDYYDSHPHKNKHKDCYSRNHKSYKYQKNESRYVDYSPEKVKTYREKHKKHEQFNDSKVKEVRRNFEDDDEKVVDIPNEKSSNDNISIAKEKIYSFHKGFSDDPPLVNIPPPIVVTDIKLTVPVKDEKSINNTNICYPLNSPKDNQYFSRKHQRRRSRSSSVSRFSTKHKRRRSRSSSIRSKHTKSSNFKRKTHRRSSSSNYKRRSRSLSDYGRSSSLEYKRNSSISSNSSTMSKTNDNLEDCNDDILSNISHRTPIKSPKYVPSENTPLKDLNYEDRKEFSSPEKVKSRWARYSLVEEDNLEVKAPQCISIGYQEIIDNIYLFVDKRKRKQQSDDMMCDCDPPTKEDILMKSLGCGSDCINRMLQIECTSQCRWKNLCTNQRFTNHVYPLTETFDAGPKGKGLRSLQNINCGDFIIEYVGEIIHYRNMHKRLKDYKRQKLTHHYLLQLSADEVVDATRKGNRSRFINHSCNPNCKTDKWTVNGCVRIGFFAIKRIKENEEITFDYKFERFGGTEQICYCGSENCRGVIGQKSNLPSGHELKQKNLISLRRDEKLSEIFDAITKFEDECCCKLRNEKDVLQLSIFMQHADTPKCREILLNMLKKTTEEACLRTFIDYHGLKLLWSLATDNNFAKISDKLDILDILEKLPIKHKTGVRESRIIETLEKWLIDTNNDLLIKDNDNNDNNDNNESLQHSVIDKELQEKSPLNINNSKVYDRDDSSTLMDINTDNLETDKEDFDDLEVSSIRTKDSLENDTEIEPVLNSENIREMRLKIVEICKRLLETWADLNEEYKIPKLKKSYFAKESTEPNYSTIRSKIDVCEGKVKFEREQADESSDYDRQYQKRRQIYTNNSVNINSSLYLSKEERRRAFEESVKLQEENKHQPEKNDKSFFSNPNILDNVDEIRPPPIITPSIHIIQTLPPPSSNIAYASTPSVYPNKPSNNMPLASQESFSSICTNFDERISGIFIDQNTPPCDPRFKPKIPPPPPKPASISVKIHKDWKIAYDNEGTPYYYNAITKETRWTPPMESSANITKVESTMDQHVKERELSPLTLQHIKEKDQRKKEKSNMHHVKNVKETFKKAMSAHVVSCLNPFLKSDLKQGRIENSNEFKNLARKLTHTILKKELSQCRNNVQDLEVNLDVKSKAKGYIERYMSEFFKSRKREKSSQKKEERNKDNKIRNPNMSISVHDEGSVSEESAQSTSQVMMPDSSISPSNICNNDESDIIVDSKEENISVFQNDEEQDEEDNYNDIIDPEENSTSSTRDE